jgi:hypothetical protein
MQKSALLRDLTIFSCLTLPLYAVWEVQNRAAERGRQRQASSVSVSESAAVSTGLPFVHLSVKDVAAGQAVKTFTSLVDRQERELGRESPDTLVSRNNLANALMAEGRYAEAETAQRSLLTDMERTFDHDHPDVFRCRFNLALNLRVQGKKEDARREMETVYQGWRNVLGEGHPRTQLARIVLDVLQPSLTLKH